MSAVHCGLVWQFACGLQSLDCKMSVMYSYHRHYAMYLAGHDYQIVYRRTQQHCNADGLSRLPVAAPDTDRAEEAVKIFYTSHAEPFPVTAQQIGQETQRDPALMEVHGYVIRGWPATCTRTELQPYYNRRHELSVSQDCLLWGNRIIIPLKFRKTLLTELHEGHSGMVRMKNLARSHFGWPGLDGDIEGKTKACLGCQRVQSLPATTPLHPWSWPTEPWERIHIDFLGPLRGSMRLVVIDAHSKWP